MYSVTIKAHDDGKETGVTTGIEKKSALFYLALGLITAGGCWLRAMRIDHPMRYDEAYSAVYFIARKDWFSYQEPNNHVLNTLLMQFCVWIGGFSPAMLRLPAFLSGVLAIPAAAFAAIAISGKKPAGLLAAGFVATSGILIEYSTNARGYSFVELATLVLLILSVPLGRKGSDTHLWIAWCVTAMLGLFTLPTMLQAVMLMSLLLLIAPGFHAAGKNLLALLVALAGIGIVTALLYTPVVRQNGLSALVANRWITPEALSLIPVDLRTLFSDLWNHWTRDASPLTLTIIAAGLAGAVIEGFRKKDAFWVTPYLAMLAMCGFILLQRRVPPARACLYILPLTLTGAAAGLFYLFESLFESLSGSFRKQTARFPWLLGLLAVTAWAGNVIAIQRRDYMISENPGTCVSAEALVEYLSPRGLYSGRSAALWDLEVSAPFLFYFVLLQPPGAKIPPDITDPACNQTYILLRHPETIRGVYSSTPHLRELFQPPKQVAALPTATVFLCVRR